MYRTVNRSGISYGDSRLSVSFLVAALSLFAVTATSAAASPQQVRMAARHPSPHRPKHPTPAGVVFGGVTSAHAPIVIVVSRNRREVVQATMAVPAQCQTSGQPSSEPVFLPVHYTNLLISGTGAFQEGGETTVSEAGETTTITGHLSGKFNRAGTSVSGTWSLSLVMHDATGAVVAQCDSGAVSFTAIQ
jgi:hypothetical protein